MLSPPILPLFLLLAGLTNYVAAQTCFHPNGNPDPNSTPCNELAEFSHCCGTLDLCLGNGYCFTSGLSGWGNRLMRGSCTDPQWQSAACPEYCYDGELFIAAESYALRRANHYAVQKSFRVKASPSPWLETILLASFAARLATIRPPKNVVSPRETAIALSKLPTPALSLIGHQAPPILMPL